MVITELIQANPRISIVIISIIVTLVSTLVTKFLTNQEHMKSLRKRQKELQEEMKKHKDNPDMLMKIQSEMLEITGIMMKSSFKPLLITFVPFLLLLYWVRSIYNPLMGTTWIWYYLIASIVASMIFRKVFDIA